MIFHIALIFLSIDLINILFDFNNRVVLIILLFLMFIFVFLLHMTEFKKLIY